MRASRLRTARGLGAALILAALALFVGWLAFREAAVRMLSGGAPLALRIAPGNSDVILDSALKTFLGNQGMLPPERRALVRLAAQQAPLDARPYLMLGHQSLLDRQDARAVAQLEAGQRLDPRQRVIHLLLLDRYLRTGRYADAAAQFSVLARLVGRTQAPIAEAMAQMSIAPETREATRRTLRTDARLEQAVLAALAKSKTDPNVILALASPTGLAAATQPNAWGVMLIERMVRDGQYAAARRLWQRLYKLRDDEAGAALYDAGLRGLPGSAPFNWSLASTGIGAADVRGGQLTVDYYGRESGELASQLLVLRPGSYRFGFVLAGAPTTAGAALSWTLACAGQEKRTLMALELPPILAKPRRVGSSFVIPGNCPAQRLVLNGMAAEFPAPINAVMQDVVLQRAGKQP